MIAKLIQWCVHNRTMVLLLTLFVIVGGVWSSFHITVDAIPDLSDVQVVIRTEWPGQAPEIVARLDGAEAVYDWGGGLVWVLVPDGTPVRAALTGGHATLFRASAARRAEAGVFQPQPAPLAALEAGLRAKFDPKGILNPGLMG